MVNDLGKRGKLADYSHVIGEENVGGPREQPLSNE